ncbi:hypothetical protein D1AOALGA4SA_5644 [Olavius algarvensis Delta 1 endosymbiont]|nr:hypothetical protein D1AOALGA4SA_5644 [Olavius algarvensis Delta 1 endosymbiont]
MKIEDLWYRFALSFKFKSIASLINSIRCFLLFLNRYSKKLEI